MSNGEMHWGIALRQMLQEVRNICKTRNQLTTTLTALGLCDHGDTPHVTSLILHASHLGYLYAQRIRVQGAIILVRAGGERCRQPPLSGGRWKTGPCRQAPCPSAWCQQRWEAPCSVAHSAHRRAWGESWGHWVACAALTMDGRLHTAVACATGPACVLQPCRAQGPALSSFGDVRRTRSHQRAFATPVTWHLGHLWTWHTAQRTAGTPHDTMTLARRPSAPRGEGPQA
jgi:hypothetical protein